MKARIKAEDDAEAKKLKEEQQREDRLIRRVDRALDPVPLA
jgi:hypothetical protein